MTRLSLRPNAWPSLHHGGNGTRPSLRTLYRALGAGLLGLGLIMVVGAGPAEARGGEKSQAVRCAKAISKSLSRMSGQLTRQGYNRCIRKYQRGRLKGTLESCLLGNPAGMVERISYNPQRWGDEGWLGATSAKLEKLCADVPDFIEPDIDAMAAVVVHTTAQFWRDLFGGDLDDALVTRADDPEMARCQRAIASSAHRCKRSHHKALSRCQSQGLESAEDLEECVAEAASRSCQMERRVQRVCGSGTTKRSSGAGPSVSHAQAFPGCGSSTHTGTAACMDRSSKCHMCLHMNATTTVQANCDLADDHQTNDSCDMPTCAEHLASGSTTLADGGVLQMNCPQMPNTTPWKNTLAANSDPKSSYGMSHFAWNSFIALNWPAKEPGRHNRPAVLSPNLATRGIPDTTKTFADARPSDLAVWETFKEKREIFHRGRCQAPVSNVAYRENPGLNHPKFVFVGCASDDDCHNFPSGYEGNENDAFSTFTSRVRTNLGSCLPLNPPVLGVCAGSPNTGCNSAMDCPGNAVCNHFSAANRTALRRGDKYCSEDGYHAAAAGQTCHFRTDCTHPQYCTYDGSSEHVAQALAGNPTPVRSAASKEWPGFPYYTSQGAVGQRHIEACPGHEQALAQLGHERHFGSPAKAHFQAVAESVEVGAQARESFTELCAGTRWCSTNHPTSGRGTCSVDSDCDPGPTGMVTHGACAPVSDPETECRPQVKRVCSLNTSVSCESAACGPDHGECITIQGVGDTYYPPCCRVKAAVAPPRVWKGDPVPAKTCSNAPSQSCTSAQDCILNPANTGTCRATGSPGRPVFYEVKLNYDYFDYIMTGTSTKSPHPWYIGEGIETAAYHGEFNLPSRTSEGFSDTPQATDNRYEIWGYNAETCRRNNGYAKVCSLHTQTTCRDNQDCPQGAGTCSGHSQELPCRTGAIQLKAAWVLLTPAEISRPRYKTAKAIYYQATNEPSPHDSHGRGRASMCRAVGTFGLLGLHIIQRTHQLYPESDITRSSGNDAIGSNYVFATWEHEDNFNNTTDLHYANHYEGVGENYLDAGFFPSNKVHGSTLQLKRLQRNRTTATTTVNNEVYDALRCKDRDSVWCHYRLVGIQFIGTDQDEVFDGRTVNGTFDKMCYGPGMTFSTPCRKDSDCGNGPKPGHGDGTCVPVPRVDGEQDYLLANLVIESNLGLQYFKGLPPKISPGKEYEQRYFDESGYCQSDPRLTCSGGQCSASSTPCYLDDDCPGQANGETCTETCTRQMAPIDSVCLNSIEYRCAHDLKTKCTFPGIPLPKAVGADETCGDSQNLSNPLCVALPKPCRKDSDCRTSDKYRFDICLNHCAPHNSTTLRPAAHSPPTHPDPINYRYRIEPRAPIPYGRDKPNVIYANEAKNMGGCMGCHGIADNLGFSFSFVAAGGQVGTTIQTTGSDEFNIGTDETLKRDLRGPGR